MVMTVQVKAMLGRVRIIDEMAKSRVKSTCYPQAPQEEVDAVFDEVRSLVELCDQCTQALDHKREELSRREKELIQTLG